jgi:transposase-like protein
LRAIYRAETAGVAELRLADFEAEWGKKYPAIAPAWRRVWNEVVPFFAYPPQIRKMIYTTNAIESLHRAQDHQNQRSIPVRRSRHQTALPGAEESWRSLEACHRVASRLRAVHHLLCRAFAYYTPLMTTCHGTLAHS